MARADYVAFFRTARRMARRILQINSRRSPCSGIPFSLQKARKWGTLNPPREYGKSCFTALSSRRRMDTRFGGARFMGERAPGLATNSGRYAANARNAFDPDFGTGAVGRPPHA